MKLAVFPNNAIYLDGSKVWLEPSMPLLLDALANSNVDILLAAQQHKKRIINNSIPSLFSCKSVAILGIVNIKNNKLTRGMTYLRQIIPIWKVVLSNDFIYVFYPGNVALLVLSACLLLRKPYGLYVRGDFSAWMAGLFKNIILKIFKRAHFIFCTGESLAIQLGNLNSKVSTVIPMSNILYENPTRNTLVRDKMVNLSILFLGRMVRDKGIYELLDAFDVLAEKGDYNIKLIYVGDGPDRQHIEEEITSRNLAGKVFCMGLISQLDVIIDLYLEADIFCLPTHHEGFPRSIYEAMYFSLPIVTTPVGQIPGLLKDGVNALFCEAGSVPSLNLALSSLLSSPSLRENLGKAGRHTLEPLLKNWGKWTHGNQVLARLQEIGLVNKSNG